MMKAVFPSVQMTILAALVMTGVSARKAVAGIQFDSTRLVLEAAPGDEVLTGSLSFRNSGSSDLKRLNITSACQCMTAKVEEKSLKPGASGEVKVWFEVGSLTGVIRKGIMFRASEDGELRSVSLKVEARIPRVVSIEPKTLKWNVGAEATPKELRVRLMPGAGLKVEKITCAAEDFQIEKLPSEKPEETLIRVTPKRDRLGKPGCGVVDIRTSAPWPRHQSAKAFLIVRQ